MMNSQKFYRKKETILYGLGFITFPLIPLFVLSDRIVERRCPFFEPPSWFRFDCDMQVIFGILLCVSFLLLIQIGIYWTIPYACVYEISSKGIKHRNFFRTELFSIKNIKKAAVKNRKGYEILEVSLKNRRNLRIYNLEKPDEFCNVINKLVVNNKK